MATQLVTFTPDTDIREAISIMLKKKISGAPVLNEQHELVGMLSEADCLRLIVDDTYHEEPTRMETVGYYMSRALKSISPDKTILDAAYEFVHSGYKRLPVMDENRLIGQISRVDVLRAIQKISPDIKHIPDSWKGREPSLPDHKKSTYNKNS
jgi:CBS domain-containing protein